MDANEKQVMTDMADVMRAAWTQGADHRLLTWQHLKAMEMVLQKAYALGIKLEPIEESMLESAERKVKLDAAI